MMRILERVLLVIGLSCLGWYGLVAADAAYTRQQARDAVERAIDSANDSPPATPEPAPGPEVGTHLLGLLEIPRLGLSTPIIEGDDPATLRAAVGHLPDTPRPWESGNSAVAAHRDGLFRPLRNIKVGDDVWVRTPRGELRYRVKDTHIVRPTDLSVLQVTPTPHLTLITCYPFNYVGSAPKRFIVHAERVE